MEKLDVVVVGGGLAGLSAAYRLAKGGAQVLVLERGDHPGSKNVTGGRLYCNPIRPYFADLWEDAPFERVVTKEMITLLGTDASAGLQFRSSRFRDAPAHSVTILRSRFDRWLGERVAEQGAFVVPQRRVTDLVHENGCIAGVVSDGEEIPARLVIAADGALSLVAEKAGLRTPLTPRHAALGVKEVIKLPEGTIEERFGVEGGEGAAHLFFGAVTRGVFGGGFLYTNRDTLSVGVVVGLESFTRKEPEQEVHTFLEEFKEREEIAPLIRNGELVEYSAHLIPERGNNPLPIPYAHGIMVAGDAAGFTVNMGITVRGMEFAMASGYLAAETALMALQKEDFTAATLSDYQSRLRRSFVLADVERFKDSLDFLDSPRLVQEYPERICGVLEELFWIGEQPKERLSSTMWRGIKQGVLKTTAIQNLWKIRRV